MNRKFKHEGLFSSCVPGLPIAVALLAVAQGLRARSSRAQAQQVQCMDSAALRHVGSSHQTGVPCIARRTLNHWTAREA